MLKEFRTFLLRGNVVDLAVAVVIGSAFNSVVQAFVKDLITPLIAALGGQPDFSRLSLDINGSAFSYGDFINQLLSFVIVAAVVFLFVVKPMNALIKLANRRAATNPPEKPEARDPQLVVLEEIRDALAPNKGARR